ncbi:MAG: hypothetical protein H7X71_08720 [Chitinophagales bacterium]|nr:hypothetical protein [Chitinophagales bacterium]
MKQFIVFASLITSFSLFSQTSISEFKPDTTAFNCSIDMLLRNMESQNTYIDTRNNPEGWHGFHYQKAITSFYFTNPLTASKVYLPAYEQGKFCDFEDYINRNRKFRIDFGTD